MTAPSDKQLIDFTRFVATKFSTNFDGWKYSRDLGDLLYIRRKSDSTGYNHWTKRLKRAFNLHELFETKKSFGGKHGLWRNRKRTLKERLIWAVVHVQVALRKESHLPDGQINGNLTFWEEDGEYIAMMGPTVGVKVLEFLEAEPDNPHAQAILAEMRRMHALSWGSEEATE